MAIKRIFAFSILIFPLAGFGQNPSVIKLQCDGAYTDYTSADLRDVPTRGMYIEVTEKKVKIFGAPGFDTTYNVTNTSEIGIGFQAATNSDYEGFLNRYSGALTLTQRINNADGSWRAKTGISGTCKKALALF